MSISLNPSSFKNTFSGEFGKPIIQPHTFEPGKEQMNCKIYVLKKVSDDLYEYGESQPCKLCNDVKTHKHMFLSESDSVRSDMYKFAMSLYEKLQVRLQNVDALEGIRAEFEIVVRAGGINPNTGQRGKDKELLIPIGPVGTVSELNHDDINSDGNGRDDSPAATESVSDSNNSAVESNVNTDVLLQRLRELTEGKTLSEAKAIAKKDPDIYGFKPFYLKVLNGEAFKDIDLAAL